MIFEMQLVFSDQSDEGNIKTVVGAKREAMS